MAADRDLVTARQTRGVEIVRPLDNYPWGMREFSLRDPNGYVLRFGMPM